MSAQSDAAVLRKAMKGIGCDNNALTGIIGHRSAEQMAAISQWYTHDFKRDLVKDLESETSGDYGKCIVAAAKLHLTYEAELLHDAVKGMGTKEGMLNELLIRRSNADIYNLRQAYLALFRRDLLQDVAGDLSGHSRDLFTAILQGQRDEANLYEPTPDVEALYSAGAGRLGTDEKAFIHVLQYRCDAHLRNVFALYQQRYGKDISKVIKSEFSGDIEDSLLALVDAVKDHAAWVAETLESAMRGFGTNERRLTRTVCRFRGPYMETIKAAYLHRFGKTLRRRIEGETSGDYKKLLLALINDDA